MAPQANALLETDLLRTFALIAETGSFTTAARRVHRTASAVSMQVRRLEEQLGRPLFLRRPRHVSLTPDGEAFLLHAREILRLNEAALARFRAPLVEGRVRFGAPDDFGATRLPAILSRFAASHPLVEVDVVLTTSRALLRRFEAGEADMVLIVTAAEEERPGEPVFSEPLAWVGAEGGEAHRRAPVPLALSAEGCPWRRAALAALDRAGTPYRIAYTSETGAGQLAAVGADLAIAPLPVSLIAPGLRRLTRKEGFGEIGPYQLRMLRGGGGLAAEAFAGHVRESFALPSAA